MLDSDQQDEEGKWIREIRTGNKRSFKKLFETYYSPLLQFAYRYVNSRSVAEGVVQDVFLWIWENKQGWEVRGKLKTYLFRAVKHQAIDYLRHERTREKYQQQFSEIRTQSISPEIPLDDEERDFVQAVQELIEELPQRPRMVYKLSRLEGLTYKEIAEVLDVSPKTVESHISRALDYLRKHLTPYLSILCLLFF
ncbi:RNA polymerase sigma-70 factor [Fodinibius salsisoli]|uniref:RNA polymerase sigma-70 factor n=1 Tax=Fodinibius salsisoli TaxID=2820877 RepID=A0ABT3PPZ2_9BACT|nr:RNA polymerase sigma-70 factor [Fodinibius salsisoli]MCW9707921.1 RNA polymerase sigma-70 factor [Fodinibius salsisoli]